MMQWINTTLFKLTSYFFCEICNFIFSIFDWKICSIPEDCKCMKLEVVYKRVFPSHVYIYICIDTYVYSNFKYIYSNILTNQKLG